MNTQELHYAPWMVEVSTFDQYSLRNCHWAKCRQRTLLTDSPPPKQPHICSQSLVNSLNQRGVHANSIIFSPL